MACHSLHCIAKSTKHLGHPTLSRSLWEFIHQYVRTIRCLHSPDTVDSVSGLLRTCLLDLRSWHTERSVHPLPRHRSHLRKICSPSSHVCMYVCMYVHYTHELEHVHTLVAVFPSLSSSSLCVTYNFYHVSIQ